MSSSKPAKPSFSAPKAKPSFSAPKPSGKKPATSEKKSDSKPVKPASAKNVKKASTKTWSSSSSEAKPVKKTNVDGAGDAKHVEKHPKIEDQVEREARASEPTPIEPSAANEGQVSDDEEEFNGFEGSDDERDEHDTSAEKQDEADTSAEKDEADTSAEKQDVADTSAEKDEADTSADGNGEYPESDTEEKPDQQQKPAAAEKKAIFSAPAAKPGASKPSKPPKVEKAPAKPPKSLTEDEYEEIFEAVFERYPPCSSQELKEFEESVARNAVTHEENKKALAAAAKEREKERKEAAKQQAKEQKEAAKQQAKEDKVFRKAQQEARRAENEARKAEIQAQKAAHEALARRQREDMGKAQKSKDPNSKAPKPKAQQPKATKPVKEKLPEPQSEQNLLDDDEQEEFAGFEDEDDVNNNSFNADEDNENERNSDSDASDDMDHDVSDDNQADDDDNDRKRQEEGSSEEEGDFQGFGGDSDDEKENTYEERLNQVLQGSQEAAIPVPNLAAQVSNPKSRPQQKKKLYERPSTFSTLSDQTRKKTQKAFRLKASDQNHQILSGPLGHRVDKSAKNKDSHRKSSSSSSRPKHSENRSKTASKHKLPRTHEEPSSKQRRPSHDVRASAAQSGKQKRQSSKDWMLEREIDTSGTWVQCSSRACLKWRYLPDVHDPATLPDVWLCSMNRNSRLNSCDVPEESWDEDEHAEDYIFTKFTEGSLVWAKMAGYPFWPAMVEVDPDYQMFCDCRDLKGVVSHYHCVFLDDHVSRAWVGTTMIRPFTGAEDPKHFGSTKVRGKDYKKLLAVAKVKAMTALKMPIEQRLRKYSFVKRYEGRWGRDQASADAEPERLVVRTKAKKDFKKKKSAAKPQRERKFSRPSLESACSSRPSVESLSDLSDEDLEEDVDHSDNDPENDLESFCDFDAAEVDAMIEGAINEEDIPVDDLLDESRDFGDEEEEPKSRSRNPGRNGAAQQKPAQVKERKSRDTKKKEGSKKKTPASTTDGLKKKTPLNYDDLPKDNTKAKKQKQKQSSKKPTAPYGKEVEQVKKSLFMSPANTPEKPENVKNSPETTANHVSKEKENQSKSCNKGSSRRGWKSTEKRKSVSFEGPKNKVKKSEDALVPEEVAVTPHESASTPMKEEEEVQQEASSSTKNNDNDDEGEAEARAETAPEKAELSQTSQKSERGPNSQNKSSQKSLVETSSQKSHQSEKAPNSQKSSQKSERAPNSQNTSSQKSERASNSQKSSQKSERAPNSQNASSQKSVAEASSKKSQKVSGSQNSKRRETLEKDFEHLLPDGSPAPKSEQENADAQSDNEELESSLDIPVNDNEENEDIFPKDNTENSAKKTPVDAADDDDSEPFDTDPLAHFECEVKQASPCKEEEKATNSGAESEDFDFDD